MSVIRNSYPSAGTIIDTARDLRSEEGENPEYDRALVEMTGTLLGLGTDEHREIVAALLGIPVPADARRERVMEVVGPVGCVEVACGNAGIELGPAQIDALTRELVDMGANFDA